MIAPYAVIVAVVQEMVAKRQQAVLVERTGVVLTKAIALPTSVPLLARLPIPPVVYVPEVVHSVKAEKVVVPAPRVCELLAAKAIANTSVVVLTVPIAPEFAPFGLANVMVVVLEPRHRYVPLLLAVPKPVKHSTNPA